MWLAIANQCVKYIADKFACQEDGWILLTEKMALVGRLCYNKQNARFFKKGATCFRFCKLLRKGGSNPTS